MPRAIVHIGTHKTGTTTFQRWAELEREGLQRATGFRYCRPMHRERFTSIASHFEFALASIRPERFIQPKQMVRDWDQPEFAVRFAAHLDRELDGEDLMISSEDLSFIRHPDEVERLRQLLPGYDLEFVVVRRDPDGFLRSYRRWMEHQSIAPSPDPESPFHLGPDAWILDTSPLSGLFPGLRWVDYDEAMAAQGSIIPALLEGMGFDPSTVPNWRVPALNSGSAMTRRINRLRWRRRRPS